MIYVKLHGRLGNLLFKIAAAASIAKEHNTDFVAVTHKDYLLAPPDNCYIEDYIKPYKDNLFRNVKFIDESEVPFNTPRFYKPQFEFIPLNIPSDCYIDGGFQTCLYFDEKLVTELFAIPSDIKRQIISEYGELGGVSCVNVRRGDYCLAPHAFPVCSKQYFTDAMNLIGADEEFIFVSDDIAWCKENFKGNNIRFFEHKSVLNDLYVQTLCKNNIISNSTFSWWGAYLNPNPDKRVIAPTPWFGICPDTHKLNVKDLYPEKWEKVSYKMDRDMLIKSRLLMCKWFIRKYILHRK